MKTLVLAALVVITPGILGCAHDSRTLVLSLQGLDCSECADQIVPALKQEPGVRKVRFDKMRVEATLTTDAAFDPARAVAAVERTGFHASIGGGHGRYVAGADYPEGADARVVVDDGRDVPDLAALAVPGKVTVVDFYADWCGPCKEVDKHLAATLARRSDVAVRKLNLHDWDSPLATHYMLPSLPTQIVFARDRRRVAQVNGLDLPALDRALDEASR